MGKTTNFEIIVGTYEEFVTGYRFNSENKELVQSFASHSHNASVRSIGHCEQYIASGGADDRIVVYDLKSRREQCMLTIHNGTVNCLQFTDGHTHLISGGSDGLLAVTRVGNWQLEKVWEKAHKGAAIIDIAIHPSSKLALTLGGDSTLRTWNLIKGRQAYAINLNTKSKDPKSLQFIKWAPDGVRFMLCGGFHTDIWNIETGGIIKPIEYKNKVSYCLFYNNNTLVTAFQNGCLAMLNLDNEEQKEIQAHTDRIKSIDVCKKYVITCSSNGEIKVWNKHLEEVSRCSTGCRLVCVNAVLTTWIKKEEDMAVNENENNLVEITEENDVYVHKNQAKVVIEEDTPTKQRKREKYIPIESEEVGLKKKQKKLKSEKHKAFETSTCEKVTKKKRKSTSEQIEDTLSTHIEDSGEQLKEYKSCKNKKKQRNIHV